MYTYTAWIVSVFGVILVLIFPHSVWIRRDTPPYSVRMEENADQNNPEFGHFLRSVTKLVKRFHNLIFVEVDVQRCS